MAELRLGVMSETELARTGHGEAANMAEFGLRLDEAKRLTTGAPRQGHGFLSELLPISGARDAGTVRNRMLGAATEIVRGHLSAAAQQPAAQAPGLVVIGLDGGYVPNRHWSEGRHFEVVAGNVAAIHGAQHRFVFARTGQANAAEAFRQVLAAAGVSADTPATVLCDSGAGLGQLQGAALPDPTLVLDWARVAVRFERTLRAARGLGAGTASTQFAIRTIRGLERAKWCLWHGRWPGCRRRLAGPHRWMRRGHVRDVAGANRVRRHITDLLSYLERNQGALVHYTACRRRGSPIFTAFAESAVSNIIAKRMNKVRQMRWSRASMRPFLNVRTAALNGTLEDAFHRYPGSLLASDDRKATAAA